MTRLTFAIVIFALSLGVHADTESPYKGQEVRDIKALSPQEIADYLDGKGLGYAKAAELNHYPGPRHVLELAGELGLSEEQIVRTEQIFRAMKSETMELGRALVDKERELDQQFADGSVDASGLQALLAEIGAIEANIRYAHLNAHLEQRALLTPHQVRQYDALRGYGSAGAHHGHSH